MPESLAEYIGYIVFFLIFVLPRILKRFRGKSKDAPPKRMPTLEEMLGGETISFGEEAEEDTASLRSEAKELKAEIDALLHGVEELERRVASRGEAVSRMQPVIASNLKAPLRRMAVDVERIQTGATFPTSNDLERIRSAVARRRKGLDLVVKMVDQRLHPATSFILNTLDVAAKDCLMPYVVHARRMNIDYPTSFAITIAEEPGFDAANALPIVAPLIVNEKTADLPRSWVHLVSDIGLDVYHAMPGLAQQISVELGISRRPLLSLRPETDIHTVIHGLMAAWLPRVFADISAACQMGPAFVFGLYSNVRAGQDEDNAVKAVIGAGDEMPCAHVRMFAALRTVAHLGFGDISKTYWEKWKRRLDSPENIRVVWPDGKERRVPASEVLGVVSSVTDYITREPFKALGSYPLFAIPSLACDFAAAERMRAMAGELVKGRAVNAPGRIMIGASLLAVDASPTAERRIGDLALKSIAGKASVAAVEKTATSKRPLSILDVARSREVAASAVALAAAVAPRPHRLGLGRR